MGKMSTILAGFAVGACEKSKVITGESIRAGDVLIGLASSGIHSNGYSLVRKVFFEKANWELTEFVEELGCTLGEELLKPTRIYVKSILQAMEQLELKGMAHITGGGFIENIPRMLPEGLGAQLFEENWQVPPVFKLISTLGGIERQEMYNVFNMGVGMVVAVAREDAPRLLAHFSEMGETAFELGVVTAREGIEIL